MNVRRIVTGHDGGGRAIVLHDGPATNVQSRRPGHEAAVIWSTDGFPVDNTGSEDGAEREIASTVPNGSVFRIVSYGPGCAPRLHRTDSIDYGVVMSGEIDMELDDGVVVHLHAGDVVVQRGTLHNWVNNGAEPCVIAFVLIDATPVSTGDGTLSARG
jgi:quercetin dioxygenase-like cupin family protein